MSVALADVRFAIQDQPVSIGVGSESPRVLGIANGTTPLFYLPLDRWQYVSGSATLFATPSGGSPAGVASSGYTISQQGLVTFTTAPGASGSPIADGSVIAASFQATFFSDADLSNVLTRNAATYGANDGSVLRGCQIEIINLLISNPDKLAAFKKGEYEKNPGAVVKAMVDLKKSLQTEIEGGIRPGRSAPVLFAAGPRMRIYQPSR